MREEIVTAVRFHPILRQQVVVRLTFAVGEGPRPDIVRWFLVREEVQKTQDVYLDDANQGDPTKERGAAPWLRPEHTLGSLP
jgi:hypothetical protein